MRNGNSICEKKFYILPWNYNRNRNNMLENPCYMRDSAYSSALLLKKLKYFEFVKNF